MRVAIAYHTEVVGQLAVLQVALSSTAQSVLGHLPTKAFQADFVGEMLIGF
jgi:hypothetical protein